ncbi:MAG: hypothetical protein HOV81_19185 [Kofleriaceae bacterium]|nr:hypothetical protein [Kofleriaceae bacterium]
MSRLKELDAYLAGELDDAAADALEEAMFDAPDDDIAFVDLLATNGTKLVRDYAFDMAITRAQIDLLIAQGRRVTISEAGPPGKYTFFTRRDAELVVTRLPINRPDLDYVDVEVYVVAHDVTKVMRDVAVNKTDGSLMGICERPLFELAMMAGPTITKVRQKDAARTVIGEWHLDGKFADAPA